MSLSPPANTRRSARKNETATSRVSKKIIETSDIAGSIRVADSNVDEAAINKQESDGVEGVQHIPLSDRSKHKKNCTSRRGYYTLSSERLKEHVESYSRSIRTPRPSSDVRCHESSVSRQIKLRIIDARPYINAKGNAFMGKGYEVVERLGTVVILLIHRHLYFFILKTS